MTFRLTMIVLFCMAFCALAAAQENRTTINKSLVPAVAGRNAQLVQGGSASVPQPTYIGQWSNGRGDTLAITATTIRFANDKPVKYPRSLSEKSVLNFCFHFQPGAVLDGRSFADA